MFDPVPVPPVSCMSVSDYELRCFHARVQEHAVRYEIILENRYIGILTCCQSIIKRITELRGQKTGVWDRSKNEPVEDLQDRLQLLIYLIGDEGLLFNSFGLLNEIPQDSFWRDSQETYKKLAFAFRNRHFASLELEALRHNLEAHDRQDREGATEKRNCKSVFEPLLIRCLYTNLHGILDRQRIKEAVELLGSDRLFNSVKSLFLFFVLSSDLNIEYYNASSFKRDLKRTKERFPPQKQTKQVALAKRNCDLFASIDAAVRSSESGLSPSKIRQFEPFSLLVQIRKNGNLNFSDVVLEQIAHCCYDLFSHSALRKEQKPSFDVQVNGIEILDIMHAFYVIFESPNTTSKSTDRIRPRGWKQSLETIFNAKLLDKIAVEPNSSAYTDSDYDAMRKAVFSQYGTPSFSFSQEAFWLLTGYTPPYNYPFSSSSNELYALVHYQLERLFRPFSEFRKSHLSEAITVFQLHSDILKAKEFWAKNWNEEGILEFCEQMSMNNGAFYTEKDRNALINWIQSQYALLSKPKTALKDTEPEEKAKKVYPKNAFKSFESYPEIMYTALLEESFVLAEIYIRDVVFSTLAKVSEALWLQPRIHGVDGKTSSSSSQADASPPGR